MKNRTILITGAAGVLGRIAAKTCAQHGATVILLDKTVPGLEAIYDDIVAVGATEPAIYPFDLAGANEDQYKKLADTIEQQFGALHGLLHNAAVQGMLGPVASLDSKTWTQVMNVNLHAPYLLSRILLPVMQQADDASIVFTSDSNARQARAYGSAYGVSKIAIEGFAGILADELESAHKIRVNVLTPGPIRAPFHTKAYPGQDKSQLAAPETLEPIYLHLLGPDSIGTTGRIFSPDNFATLAAKQ